LVSCESGLVSFVEDMLAVCHIARAEQARKNAKKNPGSCAARGGSIIETPLRDKLLPQREE